MYGGQPYAGGPYAGDTMLAAAIPVDTEPTFSVEVSFTTDALATPVWVDISGDARSWDVSRGRSRELERFQPGRATVVLDNIDRDYDSQHATGPHFGDLRPMRRIRIRETFNGVTYPRFDGFVDRWNLDYPEYGVDAVATVDATDGFKVFARTDLGASVYANEVEDDSPALWWRLDDPQASFAALDHSGNGRTGTPVGPVRFGSETLIVNDPGSSVEMEEKGTTNIATAVGALTLTGTVPFAFEFWFKWDNNPAFIQNIVQCKLSTDADALFQIAVNNVTSKVGITLINNAAGAFAADFATALVVGRRYHMVVTHDTDRVLRGYLNGVLDVTGETTSGAFSVDRIALGSLDVSAAPLALMDHFAVYTTTIPSVTRIAAHYAAGTTPWQGDLPGVRAGRVLDLADWPAGLRELDAGETTFQSAALQASVLEHLQKVAETEAGALFMNRAGMVRLISRDALAARVSQATFGDGAGEIGYRSVTFDDGDATIRNRATISRLNGVARTDEDTASVDEFGRFQYTLDGLLHDTEAHSTLYADWVTTNYGQPTRRVVSMELGPAAAGNETALYEQILGRELGDKITVKIRPPGGGAVFTQDVVIEGIADAWDPHGFRTARWTLSPAPGTF